MDKLSIYVYEKFKYFLECYFVPSYNYNELEEIAEEFKNSESLETSKKLLQELKHILNLDDWVKTQEFVLEFGMRKYDVDKTKGMVRLIIQGLEK